MSFYFSAKLFERAVIERAFNTGLVRERVNILRAACLYKSEISVKRVIEIDSRKLAELQRKTCRQAVIYIIERRFVNVLLILPTPSDVYERNIRHFNIRTELLLEL